MQNTDRSNNRRIIRPTGWHVVVRHSVTATLPFDDCATPEVFECAPYNENARLMTTMFRQQLINCETFLHASPLEICLRLTVQQCTRCKRTADEKKERAGKREWQRRKNGREREAYTAHFSREPLRTVEMESRNIRARFVRKWSVHM